MKFLPLRWSTPAMTIWTMLRWREGFRSHSGFAILAVVVIVVVVVAVFALMRDRQEPANAGTKNAGTKNESQSK